MANYSSYSSGGYYDSQPQATGYYDSQPQAINYKDQQYAGYNGYYQSGGSNYSASPPEYADASVSSGGPSYGNTGYSASSYAGSTTGDYDSSASASGVDFHEYMHDRFNESFDPIPMDRALAKQVQASASMNAKQRELLELQKLAQSRLAKTRARFAEGVQDAREVRADLEWTQKKVSSIKSKSSRKHTKEYKKARERYPSPEY